jgi:hypothetical protein
MFVCDCPICGRRELRGLRSLFTVPTDAGAVFAARCRGCGTDVRLTGLPVEETRPGTVTAA